MDIYMPPEKSTRTFLIIFLNNQFLFNVLSKALIILLNQFGFNDNIAALSA